MSAPNKIYVIIRKNESIEFSVIPMTSREIWIEDCICIDENMPVYELMDWLAEGMLKNKKFKSVFK